jgi:phosphohistidine phosphatase
MKHLVIIRHAKSDWSHSSGDRHRPLQHRGITDAGLVAAKAIGPLPERFTIWCSPAERTTQTARIFASTVGYPLEEIVFNEALYTFDVAGIEKCIRTCDNTIDCLIVFGHNEGVTDFVNKFGDIFIDNMPTAGLTSITFETDDWSRIARGHVTAVILPRDLRP